MAPARTLEHKDYHYTALQYSKLAAHYDDMSNGKWHQIARKQGEYIDHLLKDRGLETPCRILNPTCGRGTQLFGLVERGHECIGIDLAEGQIQRAQAHQDDFQKGAAVTFHHGDALNAQKFFDKEDFDVVLSFGNSLPLLGTKDYIDRFLGTAFKLLKKDGLIVITGFDYTGHRRNQPSLIQHAPVKGEKEGAWIETAYWLPEHKDTGRYISFLTFIYTRPEYHVLNYDFAPLYALTTKELEDCLADAGFKAITIKQRDDIQMPGFYIATANK